MYSRKRIRKIVLAVILLLVLAVLTVLFINFRATRQLGINIAVDSDAVLAPPQYLFSFSGPVDDPMVRPLGIFIDGERVLVSDSRRATVDVYNLDGERQRTWTNEKLLIPLYIAKNPVDGNYYISDRRSRTIHIVSSEGEFLGEFDPKLPEDQLPTVETGGVVWAPVALDFAPDGTMYVVEILRGHRLLIFDPEGNFVRSVGTAAQVENAEDSPLSFQFPNDVRVYGDQVWVVDSNNRRIQIFDLEGEFLKIFPSEGLPRGLDFLKGRVQTTEGTETVRFALVDTTSHDFTIWQADGTKLGQFGSQGVLEGQFSYPNDVAVADNGRLYIVDTSNARVQVWGWPAEEQPIPTPQTPSQWAWCLSPLLLLPLFLLLRKRKFFATEDFILRAFQEEKADVLPARRRKWIVEPEVYENVRHLEQDEIKAEDLFHPVEHSESDAQSLMDQLEIDHAIAVTLSIAKRAKLFCTEDEDMRRFAKSIDIEAADLEKYLEVYEDKHH